MVRIINGEIVPEDDPRVKELRQRPGASTEFGRGRGGVATIHDTHDTQSGGGLRRGAPTADGTPQRGVLDNVASAMGIEGRTIRIPGFLGVPNQEVPYIHLLLAAVAILIFGAKAAAVIVVAYVVINQQGSRHHQMREQRRMPPT